MAGKFNLGELIAAGKVSELDTFSTKRKQIEYIDIDLIDDDPNNFYELSGIEELAANIELCGLMDPLLVRPNPDAAGRVVIVSGHRRRAAIRMLVDDGREDLRKIACIREAAEGSAAWQELRLIYANSDTRKLTSAELAKQAERVEALLYHLRDVEGVEFPGRMRDHVAEVCNLSKTKLARLKVIREKLTPTMSKTWEAGKLKESAAYTLAQHPQEIQELVVSALRKRQYCSGPEYWTEVTLREWAQLAERLTGLSCKAAGYGGKCVNCVKMLERRAKSGQYSDACREGKCCNGCVSLGACKMACPLLAAKVKSLKEDAKAQRQQEKKAKEERDRPVIDQIMQYWQRFGEARGAAGKSVKEYYEAAGMYYSPVEDEKVTLLECLAAEFTTNTNLPYRYGFSLNEAQHLVRIADLLGCSLDYLLCRTDDPRGLLASSPADRWLPATPPPKDGQLAVAKFSVPGAANGGVLKQIAVWDGEGDCWRFAKNGQSIEAPCAGWFPLPEE